MTKTDFLEKLRKELEHKHISEADDIVEEYAQHFAFKLEDGYSEEEIAAKLGAPVEIAAQYSPEAGDPQKSGSKTATLTGLWLSGFAAALLYVVLISFGIALAAVSVGFFTASVCCITAEVFRGRASGLLALIPPMPFGCALLIGLAMAALAVLATAGCVYYFAFLRQLPRVYLRFHQNSMAAASGGRVLPPLRIYPAFSPKARRRIRRLTVISLIAFAVLFIAGVVVSVLCAGSLEFWHIWGWFGYPAP